jgi:hypothetical protein
MQLIHLQVSACDFETVLSPSALLHYSNLAANGRRAGFVYLALFSVSIYW